MRRVRIRVLALAAAGLVPLVPSAPLSAQATAPPTATTSTQRSAAAMEALAAMGLYLRGLQAFQVAAVTTDEDVLDDGQKLQYDGQVDLVAEMPSRLRLSAKNERREREMYFDGKSFTLYGKRLNYYATVPAPPTIRELATKLQSDFGLSLPLVDLFRWGAPDFRPAEFESALDAGPSAVGGVSCRRWLFRQPGLDWQLWIQSGSHPLPRKLVITTTTDAARPQYTAVYTWNLAPSYDAKTFEFVPPAGAGRVRLDQAR